MGAMRVLVVDADVDRRGLVKLCVRLLGHAADAACTTRARWPEPLRPAVVVISMDLDEGSRARCSPPERSMRSRSHPASTGYVKSWPRASKGPEPTGAPMGPPGAPLPVP